MSNREQIQSNEQEAQNLKGRPVVKPPVDIFENEDEFLIVADVPGVTQEHLQLRFDEGELSISAHGDDLEEPDGLVGREFRAMEYRRRFVVPESVDPERINAKLDNGVLSVHLPKAEAVKPRSIQVQVG